MTVSRYPAELLFGDPLWVRHVPRPQGESVRRQLGAAIVVLTLGLGLTGIPRADSAQRDDPVKERNRVRAQQAAVASHLNVQKASLAKIDHALQALTANLSAQESLLGEANQQLADARQQLDQATAAVTRSERRISDLTHKMRVRAVAAYISPPADQAIDLLRMTSVQAASYRRMYADVSSSNDADL